MSRRRLAVVFVAAMFSACLQEPAADRETNVTDPEVQALLDVSVELG
jgi:hypothetical protein